MGLLIVRSASSESSDFPDETTTGVPSGTSLTPDSGTVEITANDTIYEEMELTGAVFVNGATGVIVRKCKIKPQSGDFAGVYIDTGSVTIEDCEIDGSDVGVGVKGVRNDSGTVVAARLNIHGTEDGFYTGGAATLEDSYIHDLVTYTDPPDPHIDGVQLFAGTSNVTIRHNTIYGSKGNGSSASGEVGSSAFTMGENSSNILLDNNLFAGGVICIRNESSVGLTNVVATGNRISTVFHANGGESDAVDSPANFTTWTGNVYHETGDPVT